MPFLLILFLTYQSPGKRKYVINISKAPSETNFNFKIYQSCLLHPRDILKSNG